MYVWILNSFAGLNLAGHYSNREHWEVMGFQVTHSPWGAMN